MDRRTYFRRGLALVLLKYAGDAALIAFAIRRWWTPAHYLDSIYLLYRTFWTEAPAWLLPALMLWTLPFLWTGIRMTMERSEDAGLSPWFALGFLLPYANSPHSPSRVRSHQERSRCRHGGGRVESRPLILARRPGPDPRCNVMAVTAAAAPPGPKPSLLSMLIYFPGRDPLAFFSNLARTYGDLVAYRMGGEEVFFINDPQHIKDVLVTHNRNFIKGRGLQRAKRLLGEGLLTSEGAAHLRQRRLIQPAFHRDRIAGYGNTMVAYADRMRQAWTDGTTLDIAREMNRLTLSIVGKTLFDADVELQAADVGDALTGVMETFWMIMLPFADVIERLPVPSLRRSRAARARLDAIIYGLIADRRASGRDHGDLLSMLLSAQDEDDGGVMTDQQVRDEAMTIFLAGHETTANALTWAWYLVSGAPDVEAKLHDEIDRVLQGRLPTMKDIASLPYVERVVTESMRLYPPAWIIGRRAVAEYPIGGFVAPARSLFLMSPYVLQRDARYYADPERFDPDRWTPEFRATLPKFAYFPFGGGPRQCIGESFAWMELVLVMTTMAQRWRLRLVPGHPVVPQPLVTLRTKHGMRMTVEKRRNW